MHNCEDHGADDYNLSGFPGAARMFRHHPPHGRLFGTHSESTFGSADVFSRRMLRLNRSLLLPGVLLLLAEEPAHGYALGERLAELSGGEQGLPLAIIYRMLGHLEQDDLVTSDQVDEKGRGPARKVYRLTPKGWEVLDVLCEQMRDIHRLTAEFERRYQALVDKKE